MGFFDWLFRRAKPTPPPPPSPEDALPPPEWARFFKTGERYERFEAAVRNYFKATGRRAMITDGMLRAAQAPDAQGAKDERQYGLGNLGQVCALADESQWPSLIADHFSRIGPEKLEGPGDRNLDLVRSRLGIRLWEMSAFPKTDGIVVREDIPGLGSVLCIDHPDSISTVRRDDAEAWELTIDELFDLALRNQLTLAPVQHSSHPLADGHTLHEFLGESPFACSVALRLPGEFVEIDGPHGHFFAVPSRHRVVVMPFLSIASLRVLSNFMALVTHLDREGPGSVSPRVYWRRNGEIVELPYVVEGNKVEVTPPDRFVEYLNENLGEIG